MPDKGRYSSASLAVFGIIETTHSSLNGDGGEFVQGAASGSADVENDARLSNRDSRQTPVRDLRMSRIHAPTKRIDPIGFWHNGR